MECSTQLRALTLSNQNVQRCALPLSLQTLVCQNAFVTLTRTNNIFVSFLDYFTLTQFHLFTLITFIALITPHPSLKHIQAHRTRHH